MGQYNSMESNILICDRLDDTWFWGRHPVFAGWLFVVQRSKDFEGIRESIWRLYMIE